MFDTHTSFAVAAFVPGAPFILRLKPRGTRIVAQFGASLGMPGMGLLGEPAWTAPVDTGLPPRTPRTAAIEWARTAFPGADVRWESRRGRKPSGLPKHRGDGMPVNGDGQAARGLPIVTAVTPSERGTLASD